MKKICVIGLGYVGLPLAIELAKKFKVVGFDINQERVEELRKGIEKTREVDQAEVKASSALFTYKKEDIADSNFYIVTVPTPVNEARQPDLTPVIKATETVASVLKKGDIVVYESTVYPGCTEEICLPILEKKTGLRFNEDFFLGYSPERINPGDKERTLTKILKIVSGSNSFALEEVDAVYSAVIQAGTYRASSIKVAEAAKVIENSQRDINIAFVNELAIIFSKLGLDTREVLEAAGTKWNFLKFFPGLVGGHCIGVDPYYLTHKAESVGYHPEVILAGRRINDGMASHVAQQIVKLMIKKDVAVNHAKALVLGVTFKENCPDVRNSKVVDLIKELQDFGVSTDVFDPHALPDEVHHEYGLKLSSADCLKDLSRYQVVVVAVAHVEFKDIDWTQLNSKAQVVYDLKGLLGKGIADARL